MTIAAPSLVLIVEDDPLVRLDISLAFVDAGFSVIEVPDAESALELLDSGRNIGLVFTDIELLGEMTGIELAVQIHTRWPQIPVLVTSGRQMPDTVPEDHFFPKPYNSMQVTSQARHLAA